MAEPYVSSLFVGREETLQKILAWANDRAPSHRLYSIVGSPGVGKSFLLHRVCDLLREDPDRYVLWLNASGDPLIRQGPDVRGKEGLAAWLEDAVKKARNLCSEVRPFDSGISPDATIDTLASDLCDKCPRAAMPILIVDSFDELEEQEVFEERVLAPFLARSCTRILLSRRDQYGLTSPTLRWNEYADRLPLMTASEGQEQVDRRIQYRRLAPHLPPVASQPPADLLERIKALVPEYAWNYPGINTFLVERAIQHQRQQPPATLSVEDLRDCILDVTRALEPLSNAVFALLTDIATHPALEQEWTVLELIQALKVDLEDERLLELFARGVVFHIEGTGHYKVADGFRELLQAWHAKNKVAYPPAEQG